MNFTVLAKALKTSPKARGVASGALAGCTSVGLVIADTLGAYLFNVNDRAPFAMCFFAFAALSLLIIGLRFCG